MTDSIKVIKGNIKDSINGAQFEEVEAGLYEIRGDSIGEYSTNPAQYICAICLSPDIYKFDSYAMIFEKKPTAIMQVAQWRGRASLMKIKNLVEALIRYYSNKTKDRLVAGINRSTHGEHLINELRRGSMNKYDFYTEPRTDNKTGLTVEEPGIKQGDDEIVKLIEDLHGAFSSNEIYPLPNSNVDVMKQVLASGDKYIIPDKHFAFVLALAIAKRIFKNHPYRANMQNHHSKQRELIRKLKRKTSF